MHAAVVFIFAALYCSITWVSHFCWWTFGFFPVFSHPYTAMDILCMSPGAYCYSFLKLHSWMVHIFFSRENLGPRIMLFSSREYFHFRLSSARIVIQLQASLRTWNWSAVSVMATFLPSLSLFLGCSLPMSHPTVR